MCQLTRTETAGRSVIRLPLGDRFRRALNVAALTGFVLLLLWLRSHIQSVAQGVIDAEAYWRLELDGSLYQQVPGRDAAFLYSPLIAQLIAPLTALPYEAFHALLMAINGAALLWMLGPVLSLASLAFPPVMLELAVGNIHLLIAAAIVAGVRYHPAWQVFPLLSKVTPGAVGVLYDVLRAQWRRVGTTLTALLVLTGASVAVAPDLWVAWVQLLVSNDRSGVPTSAEFWHVPFWIRLAAAAAIVGLAAARNLPALLPVAALLALPFVWDHSLSLLVAIWPLWRQGLPRR